MANSTNGEIIYSDVNINLGQSSPYELVYNEAAIQNSILNIIRTRRGSRPFRRQFGSGLMDMLFDPLDDITASRMSVYLKQDILAYESRITLQKVEVIPDMEIDGYYVNIVGSIPLLDNRSFDFNFNLQRKTS